MRASRSLIVGAVAGYRGRRGRGPGRSGPGSNFHGREMLRRERCGPERLLNAWPLPRRRFQDCAGSEFVDLRADGNLREDRRRQCDPGRVIGGVTGADANGAGEFGDCSRELYAGRSCANDDEGQ
jgi:hypothetical protein